MKNIAMRRSSRRVTYAVFMMAMILTTGSCLAASSEIGQELKKAEQSAKKADPALSKKADPKVVSDIPAALKSTSSRDQGGSSTNKPSWFRRFFSHADEPAAKPSAAKPSVPVATNALTIAVSNAVPTAVKVTPPSGAVAPSDGKPRQVIRIVSVKGDADFFQEAGGDKMIKDAVVGKPLTREEVDAAVLAVSNTFYQSGYYLSSVARARNDVDTDDRLDLVVNSGRFGTMTFKQMGKSAAGFSEVRPYVGSYFSESQFRNRFQALASGRPFDYNRFASELYELNSHPDLTLDCQITGRTEPGPEGDVRYADMQFMVQEEMPLHAVLEFNNQGTEESGDYRMLLTLQYLNLTRHDDTLTVRGMTSPDDFSATRSVTASYQLPYFWSLGGAYTLFVGWSDVASDNLATSGDGELSVEGNGTFVGAQMSYNLVRSANHHFSTALGLSYRDITDSIVLNDLGSADRDIEVLPLSLSFSYAAIRQDFLGGRLFATSETVWNAGDMTGMTTDEDAQNQRDGAKADYWLERFQLARNQPLFGGIDKVTGEKKGQWTLFMKADIQLTDQALIPSEQKGVGGAYTVRGYEEREVLGDSGISGSIELRTPAYVNTLMRPLVSSKRNWLYDNVQFLAFSDWGYVRRNKTLQVGEEKDESLSSVGAGVRYAFSSSGAIRLDAGYRLLETVESDRGVGADVVVQFYY